MRVEFKTDARNERSRAALAALPAQFEGIFRRHMVVPGGVRDSAYYSVVDDEWPRVRANLQRRLRRDRGRIRLDRRRAAGIQSADEPTASEGGIEGRSAMATTDRIEYRTCPLCEATCGLALTLRGDEVLAVRGDDDDVFSRGFICPKGTALKALHEDPDRVRRPLRRACGRPLRAGRLGRGVRRDRPAARARSSREHGTRRGRRVPRQSERAQPRRAALSAGVLLQALGTRNVFSASTGRPDAEAGVGGAHVRRRRSAFPCPTSTAPTTCSCSAPTRSRPTAA